MFLIIKLIVIKKGSKCDKKSSLFFKRGIFFMLRIFNVEILMGVWFFYVYKGGNYIFKLNCISWWIGLMWFWVIFCSNVIN